MTRSEWSAAGPITLGCVALAVLLGGFLAWATFTRIAGAVIALGHIEVDQNRQVIQHPTGGVVAHIAVKEGDVVRAGDLLIRLDSDRLRTSLDIVEGQLHELSARRARLEAEQDQLDRIAFDADLVALSQTRAEVRELIEGQRKQFAARRDATLRQGDQLRQRADQIRNQILGIKAQETSLLRQSALIDQELGVKEGLLARGLTQASGVLALQRQAAALAGQSGALAAARAEAEQRITEIEIEVLRLASTQREAAIARLRDVRARAFELRQQRGALLLQIAQMGLRAPVSGIVHDMQVHARRSVVRGAEPVMFLIPQDRPLVIAARIDPIHIDQVIAGQQVNLRFSALNQRITPELTGHVSVVSADAFENPKTGARHYRAEIALDPGEVAKLGQGQMLLPGMPVDAFIRTSDRSPLGYLVKPMADYFTRAFRES